MRNNNLFPTLTRWAILLVLIAAGLLLVAGTTHLPRLNAYIVALAPSLLVMMLAVAPRIAQQRGQADAGEKDDLHDRTARLALVTLFLITILTAALDAGRLHISSHVPLTLSAIALAMYIAGSGFQAWAMDVNSFYSPVIHVQSEQGHSVVTRGPYRILRHPAYFANFVAIPASALAIGSWIALLPATLFCAITVWRARREDIFLKQNLSGYKDYMERVRGGIFPYLSFKL